MKILLHNHQKQLLLKPNLLNAWVTFFMTQAAHLNPERTWGDLDVVLCEDTEMAAYNRQCFGRDQATDVITLTYSPMPGPSPRWSGELLINAQRALECGPAHGGVPHELLLYLAHGCDHLTGADDAEKAERAKMRTRELKWIKQGQQSGLSLDLLKTREPTHTE